MVIYVTTREVVTHVVLRPNFTSVVTMISIMVIILPTIKPTRGVGIKVDGLPVKVHLENVHGV